MFQWRGSIINLDSKQGSGSNTGVWLLKNLQGKSTTGAHEMGHGWGAVKNTENGHPVETDIRGKGQPGMMYPRGTIVGPEYQYDPKASAGALGGTLDPSKRAVNQQDVDFLELDKLTYTDGKATIGTLTNIKH